MTARPDCPPAESWQALFGGELPPDQRERCEQHLESCAACQARLDGDEGCGEEIRGLARRVGDPTAAPADPTLVQVVDRVLHEVPGPERPAPAEPPELYFLRPAGTASPPIAVHCPGFGHNLKVRAGLAGKKVKCPRCGQPVPVPAGKAADSGITPA
jgi:anti-sigma factor RsiW